jgi:hypothetical protein
MYEVAFYVKEYEDCQSLVYLAMGPDEAICGIFLGPHVCNGLLFL